MDKKQRNFIMGKLRSMSKMYSERTKAKNLQKKGPMTFKCSGCGLYVYEGKKTLEKALLSLELPPDSKIEAGKGEMDHKEPIGAFDDWNGWIDRLFCDSDNWSYLCKICHLSKSAYEAGERKNERDEKKKLDKKSKK